MALLSKTMYAKIEGKLHHREQMKADVELWYRDADLLHPYDQALSRQPITQDVGGGHAKVSDSTALTAVRRNSPPGNIKSAERWLNVLEAVFERLRGTPKETFVLAFYNGKREHQKMEKVCRKLYISMSTAYQWRDEIVNMVALVAAMRGLIREE